MLRASTQQADSALLDGQLAQSLRGAVGVVQGHAGRPDIVVQLSRMKPTPIEPKITDELNTTDEPGLTEAEIDALLAQLPEQYTFPKVFQRSSRAILIVSLFMFSSMLIASLSSYGSVHWQPILMWAALAANAMFCLITTKYMNGYKILKTKPNQNAPEVVGYCLNILNMSNFVTMRDGNVSLEAAALLTHYLPRINEEEMDALTAEQRSRLNFLLSSKEPRLACAALGVIAAIGDKNASSYVESLIKHTKDTSIRTAAQECLLAMQERAALLTDSSVLLRASEPETHRQELLRAATPVSETRPQELLLPAAADPQKLVL